jgi:hypothetical protein
MHGLNGYKEVIDSVQWGLEQLGHDAFYALNNFNPTSNNIIFGAQVLSVPFLQLLPANTIVYNFEQFRGRMEHQVSDEVRFFAKNFHIWEYSLANIDFWHQLGADKGVTHVPVGYAPVLTRIERATPQDIDVLIYGLAGEKRLDAFQRLSHAGYKVMMLSGFYGDERDALIARSKIVLNVNLYDFAQIFEIVRVSYLLANQKAVIATLDERTAIEADLDTAVCTTSMDRLVEDCSRLLANDAKRAELELAGFEVFRRRDVVTSLQAALLHATLV